MCVCAARVYLEVILDHVRISFHSTGRHYKSNAYWENLISLSWSHSVQEVISFPHHGGTLKFREATQ